MSLQNAPLTLGTYSQIEINGRIFTEVLGDGGLNRVVETKEAEVGNPRRTIFRAISKEEWELNFPYARYIAANIRDSGLNLGGAYEEVAAGTVSINGTTNDKFSMLKPYGPNANLLYVRLEGVNIDTGSPAVTLYDENRDAITAWEEDTDYTVDRPRGLLIGIEGGAWDIREAGSAAEGDIFWAKYSYTNLAHERIVFGRTSPIEVKDVLAYHTTPRGDAIRIWLPAALASGNISLTMQESEFFKGEMNFKAIACEEYPDFPYGYWQRIPVESFAA